MLFALDCVEVSSDEQYTADAPPALSRGRNAL
jgi:hypothetical protein